MVSQSVIFIQTDTKVLDMLHADDFVLVHMTGMKQPPTSQDIGGLTNRESDLFIRPFYQTLEIDWSVTHTRRGGEGRQEGGECGYYHLHRNLNQALLLHCQSFSLVFVSVCCLWATLPRCRHQGRWGSWCCHLRCRRYSRHQCCLLWCRPSRRRWCQGLPRCRHRCW